MKRFILGSALAAGLVGSYIKFIRPRQMRWGATDEEAQRTFPYDELTRRGRNFRLR